MSFLLELPLSTETGILVEVRADETSPDFVLDKVAGAGPAARTELSYQDSVEDVGSLIAGLSDVISSVDVSEVTTEFGIRFGGTRGLILVAPDKGTLKFTVSWKSQGAVDSPSAARAEGSTATQS